MKPPTREMPWYAENRALDIPEKNSLDLARHLPQRSIVGAVVVVSDRPAVMLPVVRKRWLKVIREVERQLSSTLDRTKRESLQHELHRMKCVTFAVNTAYLAAPADVLFTSSEHLTSLNSYRTLYLLDAIRPDQYAQLKGHLLPGGLIISYTATQKEI